MFWWETPSLSQLWTKLKKTADKCSSILSEDLCREYAGWRPYCWNPEIRLKYDTLVMFAGYLGLSLTGNPPLPARPEGVVAFSGGVLGFKCCSSKSLPQ